MAVNESRSMNAELDEGRTDGTFYKLVRDRGGEVDPITVEWRELLHPWWYSTPQDVHKAHRDLVRRSD